MDDFRWLLIPAVLGALLLLGYLAACAGAERWLTLREWWCGSATEKQPARGVPVPGRQAAQEKKV